MISKTTGHYVLTFYDNFVIAEAFEGSVITNEIVAEHLKIVFKHYHGKNFTLITHRKNNYTVKTDVYTLKLMKKLKALAVVSPFSSVKEKAFIEQLAFDQSFAFFENIEDAMSWAETALTA